MTYIGNEKELYRLARDVISDIRGYCGRDISDEAFFDTLRGAVDDAEHAGRHGEECPEHGPYESGGSCPECGSMEMDIDRERY